MNMTSDLAQPLLTIDHIRDAAARIEGAVVMTAMDYSRTLSEITGADIWLKFENLQFTAAYKERGALNRLLVMGDNALKNGVIACVSDTSFKAPPCLTA